MAWFRAKGRSMLTVAAITAWHLNREGLAVKAGGGVRRRRTCLLPVGTADGSDADRRVAINQPGEGDSTRSAPG